jgi:cysteinyl-tRNA synthetase
MLKTHYRQPIDWTAAALRESKRELDKWYPVALQYAGAEAMLSPEFEAALCDDLNTPDAITHLRRLYSEAQAGVAFAGARLHACGALLGLFQHDLGAWNGWRPASAGIDELAVQRLINARLAARAQKNWAESDRIRDELAAMGVQLKDGKDANGAPTTHWEVKR